MKHSKKRRRFLLPKRPASRLAILAVVLFAAIGGVYLVYKSLAATYPTKVSIYVKDYRRGPALPNISIGMRRYDGSLEPCSSAPYHNTDANGNVAWTCYLTQADYFYFVAGNLRGYVLDPASPNKFNSAFQLVPNQPKQFIIFLTGDPDHDGVYDAYDKCPDQTGPKPSGCPAPPAINYFTANGVNGNINVTVGSALTLAWRVSGTYLTCNGSGNWGGGKPAAGSENHNADTSKVATKSYSLSCYNGGGVATATRQVSVTAKPAPPPPPPPPAATPGKTSTKPPTSVRRTAGTISTSSHAAIPPLSLGTSPDTTPPSSPTDFNASQEGGVVNLNWGDASDDVLVTGYVVERSSDQTNWEELSREISGTSYTDETAEYNTQYSYRVAALDAAGNMSEYATADIETSAFEPNVKTGEASHVASDDGVISVEFPEGSFDEDVFCAFVREKAAGKNVPGEIKIGPHNLVCKDQKGAEITKFNKDALFTIKKANPSKLTLYGVEQNGDAKKIDATVDNKAGTLSFKSDHPFLIVGVQITKSLSPLTIILIIVILISLVGGAFWYIRRRNAQQQNYDEYIRRTYIDPKQTVNPAPTHTGKSLAEAQAELDAAKIPPGSNQSPVPPSQAPPSPASQNVQPPSEKPKSPNPANNPLDQIDRDQP